MCALRIGVVSDTHIPGRAAHLPSEVLLAFERVDLILHAGDLLRLQVLETLRKLAPVEAVCGNVDDLETRLTLPRRRIIELPGCRLGLIHGDNPTTSAAVWVRKAFASEDPAEAVHCVVFGHSHQPLCGTRDGVLYFNPGSPTDCRRAPRPSFGILHVDGEVRGEIRWL
jgi:putative phosphoesterase